MVKLIFWEKHLKPILLLVLLVASFQYLLFPISNNRWTINPTASINTVRAASQASQSSITLSSKLAEYCIDQLGSLETASHTQETSSFTKGQRQIIRTLSNQEITSSNRLFLFEGDGLIDPDGRLAKKSAGTTLAVASGLLGGPAAYQGVNGGTDLAGITHTQQWSSERQLRYNTQIYNLTEGAQSAAFAVSGAIAPNNNISYQTMQFEVGAEAPASNEPLEVGGALREPGNIPPKLYHYTLDQYADGIDKEGLRPDRGLSGKIFTTPNGNLTPTQAQIDLGLKPNRGLPQALFEIDAAALQKNGINPTFGPVRVQPTGTSPGGGEEIIYEKEIKPKYLNRIR